MYLIKIKIFFKKIIYYFLYQIPPGSEQWEGTSQYPSGYLQRSQNTVEGKQKLG